jgi:CBS domain-containing protein
MRCEEIMSHEVQWIAPDESVARAAELMAFNSLGFLPICSADGRPLGVITDRDIALRVTGENRLPSQTPVEEVMTAPVHSVGPDCAVSEAGEVMAEQGVSRLLVLDDDGVLQGVVSLADLVIRGPGHTALQTARGIFARVVADRSHGRPHLASVPTPEFFHGARDLTYHEDFGPENPARLEAEVWASGRNNTLKEFP